MEASIKKILIAFVSGGALAALFTFVLTTYNQLNEAKVKEGILAAKEQVMEEINKSREKEHSIITEIVRDITMAKGKALSAVERAESAVEDLNALKEQVANIEEDAKSTFTQIDGIRNKLSKAANVDIDALAAIVEPLVIGNLSLQNSILAFNQESCPEGWKIYEPAQGRFLRGIDRKGSSDIKDRAPGSLQGDTLQNHLHEIEPVKSAAHQPSTPAPHGYGSGGYGHNIAATRGVLSTSASVSNETRPKNVAVCFCIKQ